MTPPRYDVCCEHCGTPLTPGEVVFGCGPMGGVPIRLESYCADPDCRRERDQAALDRAIQRGLIDP